MSVAIVCRCWSVCASGQAACATALAPDAPPRRAADPTRCIATQTTLQHSHAAGTGCGASVSRSSACAIMTAPSGAPTSPPVASVVRWCLRKVAAPSSPRRGSGHSIPSGGSPSGFGLRARPCVLLCRRWVGRNPNVAGLQLVRQCLRWLVTVMQLSVRVTITVLSS